MVNLRAPTPITLFALGILVVSVMGMFSAVLTEATQQAQAQSLKVQEQKAYVTDINVHFKTFCISVIVITYCL